MCLWTVHDVGLSCAAKLNAAGKGKGAFLQRGFSGRKAARSDYEEQQMLLGLKALENMKQMVLVRNSRVLDAHLQD